MTFFTSVTCKAPVISLHRRLDTEMYPSQGEEGAGGAPADTRRPFSLATSGLEGRLLERKRPRAALLRCLIFVAVTNL